MSDVKTEITYTKSLSAEKAMWIEKAPKAFSTAHRSFGHGSSPESHLRYVAKLMLSVFDAKVGELTYDVENDRMVVWVE